MNRTFTLAQRGRGEVAPNPRVGAVLVDPNGKQIGEGYHRHYGGDHAEIEVIKACRGKDLRGSTLVVNLEPCCHQGKTPPCTGAILSNGIAVVIVGTTDPNPKMNGKGAQILRDAGIKVEMGLLQEDAQYLNRGYISARRRNRAWCAVKIALSIDGRMANHRGQSKWITGTEARKMAHILRSDHDGILVGGGTIRHDNPELTVRLAKGPNPTRVVLSPGYGLPADSKIARSLKDVRTILVTGEDDNTRGMDLDGLTILRLPRNRQGVIDPGHILSVLPNFGVQSLLIEGGAGVLSTFMQAGVVDEISVGIAPTIIGKGISPFENFMPVSWDRRPRFITKSMRRLGSDIMISYVREGDLFSPD